MESKEEGDRYPFHLLRDDDEETKTQARIHRPLIIDVNMEDDPFNTARWNPVAYEGVRQDTPRLRMGWGWSDPQSGKRSWCE